MGAKKVNQFWLIQNGVMTGTSTILSTPQNLVNLDNIGLEVTWTGTPSGTISVLGSVSAAFPIVAGPNYYALTFDPPLEQPAVSSGGYLIDLRQFPFPFMAIEYVNSSGSGVLNVYMFGKDLN